MFIKLFLIYVYIVIYCLVDKEIQDHKQGFIWFSSFYIFIYEGSNISLVM